MTESASIKAFWTSVTVFIAAVAAYAFSCGADILLGELAGVHPPNVIRAPIMWLSEATIAMFVAMRIRSSRGWLPLPFILVTVVTAVGAAVGPHPHNWGVSAVMGLLSIIVRRLDGAPFNSPVVFRPASLDWDPVAHSDEENSLWSVLRAVEWGRWPLFLSQPIAPVLLIWWQWNKVIAGFFLANSVWALVVRYRVVSCSLAVRGVYLAMARWITWPCATVYLFYHRILPEAWVALAWPWIIFPLGAMTPTTIDRIQPMFMEALGYVKKPSADEAVE